MRGAETAARLAKAEAIARALRQAHIRPGDAALIDQPMRDQLARACGQRPPSTTTWLLVLGLLVSQEADIVEGNRILEEVF